MLPKGTKRAISSSDQDQLRNDAAEKELKSLNPEADFVIYGDVRVDDHVEFHGTISIENPTGQEVELFQRLYEYYQKRDEDPGEGKLSLTNAKIAFDNQGVKSIEMSSSPAQLSPDYGGIDFNPNNINLSEQGDKVQINFSPTDIQSLNLQSINGILPVIINISPLPSVLPLLGLSPQKEEEFEVSSLN